MEVGGAIERAQQPSKRRELPRPFSFHWGSGQVIEEAWYTGTWHEPALQLLEYEDGSRGIRFCFYDHRGHLQRSPLVVSEEELEGLKQELDKQPALKALLTALSYGELVIRRGREETLLAIGGGFLEVRPDQVIILADMAERAEEIDIARAEEARQRAQERLAVSATQVDLLRAEFALRRSETRLRVARRRRGMGAPSLDTSPDV